ncbi:MAG: hypothetical protein ACK4VZ_04900 [Paracoccaceae bacterium]
MSEPMSSHEIEDVLSSIRRLVSEDLRPSPRAAEAEAQGAAGSADKLVLTPALRVVAEPGARQPDAPLLEPSTEAQAQNTPTVDTGAGGDPVEHVVARLGAAVTEEEWESPFGDPAIWPGSTDEAPATDAAQGFVAHPRAPLDFATDVGPEDVPPEFLQSPVSEFAEVEEVLQGSSPTAPPDPRAPLRKVTPPQDAEDWAEAAEAAVRADLAQGAEDEVISGLYGAQGEGMVFDEEVLRDLVRDLIREELSGTLGERITRNVRKLVRAEIARAIALRDFE